MQFQSIEFLVFLFLVCLGYYGIPGKLKKYWLLLASWVFYLLLGVKFAAYLGGITLLSWGLGIWLDSGAKEPSGKRKADIAIAVSATFAALVVVKYGNFILTNVHHLVQLLHISAEAEPSRLGLLQPVGLSFFTFAAVGYLIDVYRENRKAEKNLVSYALFLSFFPTIMSGPIERSTGFLHQIDNIHTIKFDTYNVRHGLLTMLYGYFLKIMVADRLNILVNSAFANPETYGGAILVFAVVGFGLQLYCDFAGISTIALGAGEVMGFKLTQNFETPYFSTSIAEFWRRWHISLSSWFRDYLYFPLGGNRKGKWRKYLNLMIVFLVSGLWHGAGWSFIVWGGLNGFYQIAGDILKPLRKKVIQRFHIDPENAGNRFLRIVFNFALVNFAWLFFRASGMSQALLMIKRTMTSWNIWELFDGTFLKLGLGWPDLTVLLISLLIVLVMSIMQYHKIDWKEQLMNQGFVFRLIVYVLSITALLIFGIYGSSYSAASFIYVDF